MNVDSDSWKIKYKDESNDDKWIEYRVNPEYHGGGYPILVKIPEPNKSELIKIAIESEQLDEIAGAALFLFWNERDNKTEFRDELIQEVEKLYKKLTISEELTEFNKSKIRTIIYESNLYDSTNLRPIIGKKFAEIEKDHQYFKSIAERAKRILDESKKEKERSSFFRSSGRFFFRS